MEINSAAYLGKVKITFKHWITGEECVREGTLPAVFNNQLSDRYLLCMENNEWEDIIKETVVEIVEI